MAPERTDQLSLGATTCVLASSLQETPAPCASAAETPQKTQSG